MAEDDDDVDVVVVVVLVPGAPAVVVVVVDDVVVVVVGVAVVVVVVVVCRLSGMQLGPLKPGAHWLHRAPAQLTELHSHVPETPNKGEYISMKVSRYTTTN